LFGSITMIREGGHKIAFFVVRGRAIQSPGRGEMKAGSKNPWQWGRKEKITIGEGITYQERKGRRGAPKKGDSGGGRTGTKRSLYGKRGSSS